MNSLVFKEAESEDTLLTLEEVKAFLRIEPDQTVDDDLVGSFTKGVEQLAEEYTCRSFGKKTWLQYFDCFAEKLKLQRGPVIEVVGIKYLDSDGEEVTIDQSRYVTVITSEPGRVVAAEGYCWPTTLNRLNAVEVEFKAGYEDADLIPTNLKLWMFRAIGWMYENRQATELPPAFLNELFKYAIQV